MDGSENSHVLQHGLPDTRHLIMAAVDWAPEFAEPARPGQVTFLGAFSYQAVA
jgi:hypothetical protein